VVGELFEVRKELFEVRKLSPWGDPRQRATEPAAAYNLVANVRDNCFT
jgi:hypothetical protein